MPLYRYDSYNRDGKRVSGTIDASSSEGAKRNLQGQGLMPFSVKEVGTDSASFSFLSIFEPKIEFKTKVIFTKQLSVLLKAGVPLLQALDLLIEQFDKKFKTILINVKDGVKAGQSFADQLSNYPKVFSKVYVQLVKAGEASGKLYLILNRLISYMEREEETKKRIKKATSYPIFVLGFSFAVIIALLAFLVPRITTMFEKMGGELPGPTLFLKNVSDLIVNNYLSVLIFVLFFIVIFTYWKSTPQGKKSLDGFFLSLPLTSYFSKTKVVVQFTQTLGMLLEAGVNLSESLDIVTNIVENSVLIEKLNVARENIIKEGKIAKYLKETGIFPNIATYMISTGEQSGKLGEMLLNVGNDYDEELKEIVDSLIGKIGPITTIVTGLIIGFIVIAVFLPIVEMGNLSGI